jgi:preprotein translocase subunit YajC
MTRLSGVASLAKTWKVLSFDRFLQLDRVRRIRMRRTVSQAARLFLASVLTALPALAWAQAPAAGPAPSPLVQLVPFIAIFAIMYFLMIRPQMKRQKAHQEFLSKIKRGDEVLTSGGILGRIEGLTDMYVTLEIAPDVRIKILRSQVASTLPTTAASGTNEVKA